MLQVGSAQRGHHRDTNQWKTTTERCREKQFYSGKNREPTQCQKLKRGEMLYTVYTGLVSTTFGDNRDKSKTFKELPVNVYKHYICFRTF